MILKLKKYFLLPVLLSTLFSVSVVVTGCADLHRAESAFQNDDHVGARKQWEILASRGFPQAYVGLGKIIELDNAENTDLALQYYQHAYDLELDSSAYYIGRFYHKNYQNQEELMLGKRWIVQAAKQGSLGAYMHYADMQLSGIGEAKNTKSALAIFKTLSEHEYASASRKLAFLYEKGRSVAKDNKQAFHYFNLAVEQGSLESEIDVARFYAEDLAGENDRVRAENVFLRHAKTGNPKATYLLAQLLEKQALVSGQGSEQARHWYRVAADQGYLPARFVMLDMMVEGEGLTQNIEKAKVELRLLSEQNQALASFRLGDIYNKENNIEQALYYYQQAFLQGSNKPVAELARFYRQRFGLNDAAIKTQYEKLANTDRVEAAFLLGVLYDAGANRQQALYWHKKAASGNYFKSFIVLAEIYRETGNVGASNKWLLKAAQAGNEKAMLQYGEALFRGRSMRADKVQGLAYVLAAARLRVGGAVTKSLSLMDVLKNAEKVEQANQRSKQIVESHFRRKLY